MTTVAQVKQLVQPLLQRNPDLALVGRLVVVKSVHHILRGISIGRVDVTNLDQMLWAMITRTDPADSIQFIKGSWDSNADPAIPPSRRKAGDITHSVALINACKPFHWKDEFPPSNTPSPEVARKAREKFGWLLNGKEPG